MLPSLIAAAAVSPLTLTFVRHAETVANATGRYSGSTLNRFSRKGEQEVSALPAKLASHYDFILVSPSERALRTIAPYLRTTHQKGTIWPLLYECCTGRRPAGAHPTSFRFGAQVSIPADLRGLFVIVPGQDRLPVAADYDSGLAQVAAEVRAFREEGFQGSVLMVGHSGNGGHFLHELTGNWIKLDNGSVHAIGKVKADGRESGRAYRRSNVQAHSLSRVMA